MADIGYVVAPTEPLPEPEIVDDFNIDFTPIINIITNHSTFFIVATILIVFIIAIINIFLYLGDRQVQDFVDHSRWSSIQQWIDYKIKITGVDPRRTSFVRWLYFCVFRSR